MKKVLVSFYFQVAIEGVLMVISSPGPSLAPQEGGAMHIAWQRLSVIDRKSVV